MSEITKKKTSTPWHEQREKILFFAGLIGFFGYTIGVTMGGYVFHVEFTLGFIAMMGIGGIQWASKS